MKKLILILVVVLIGAAFNNSYGQTCPTPRPIVDSCLNSDAMHPVAGVPYTYTVNVPTPPGTKEYTWFVTQDQNFITGGNLTLNRETVPASALIMATGPGYNNPATGTNTVDITWKAFSYNPLQPVFVVIYVENQSSGPDACLSNNMRVYMIEPQIAFTLDIANVSKAGLTANYEDTIPRCLHDIVSAIFNPAAPNGVMYDFGADTLYYVVTAANFDTSWLPQIQISGLDPAETISSVQWDTSFAFNNPVTFNYAAPNYTSPSPVPVRNSSLAVGPEGECVWIRVAIDHSIPGVQTYQGLTDETIALAIDGHTNLTAPTPFGDLHWSAAEPVPNVFCGEEDGFQFDLAIQILKARPDVQDATPPAGDDFLPVQP